jgi:phospholipid/cholesterol/gamma-HCH transport system substrate-binding protein
VGVREHEARPSGTAAERSCRPAERVEPLRRLAGNRCRARFAAAGRSAPPRSRRRSQPGIGELTAVAGQIAGNVADVASRVETAFDDQAAKELRASIRNVADLSATVRGVVRDHAADLDTISIQLRTAVLSLNRTAANVELTARRIDSATTSAEVRSLVENMSAAGGELRHAALRVRELSTGMSATQKRADSFLARGDSVLGKMNRGEGSLGLLLNDSSLYRHADSLVIELRALAADIRANPKRYLSLRIF